MTYISAALRREVIERANSCCEYCHVHQKHRLLSYEIDHIIAEKHRGATLSDNLCYSCHLCNGFKGSDVSSVDWDGTGEVVALFHPRKHQWDMHFQMDGAIIQPMTPQGRVTVDLLHLNDPERITERILLIRLGRYPCG
jgi:hypothetical protein